MILNKKFSEKIGIEIDGSVWSCVAWLGSEEILETGKAVKIKGTVDGHPIETALLPSGKSFHMLSLNKKMLSILNKEIGDTVEVFIEKKV